MLEREGNAEQALISYRAQLAHTPATDRLKHSQLEFRIGECLLALDRANEAFSAFRRAAEIDDTNSMAHLRLGQLYMQAGEPEQSSEQALTVLQQSGPNAEALALIASAASAAGKLKLAQEFFEHARELAPNDVKLSLGLAEVYDRLGDGARARETLAEAARLRPSAAPWLALGRLEESDGHVEAANNAYRQAVAAEDTPESNLRLAQFLERSSEPGPAEEILRRVDRMRPLLPVTLADYEFRTGRPEFAAVQYRLALGSESFSWRAFRLIPAMGPSGAASRTVERSQIVPRLIEAELQETAARDSAQITAAAGEHLERYHRELDAATRDILRAEIALAQDDLETAAQASSSALERAPDSAAAHYVAGVLREREGNQSGAQVEWETALDKDSDYIPARVVLAEAELKAGKFSDAQRHSIVALRAEPGNRRALISFARASIGLRQFGAARAIAVRLKALVPDAPESSLILAEIAMEDSHPAGTHPEEALRLYEAVISSHPDSDAAVEGLARIYAAVAAKPRNAVLVGEIERTSIALGSSGFNASSSSARLEALGRALVQIGKNADAERCLRESLQLDSSREIAAEWLARLQAEREDEPAARQSAAHLRQLYPLLAAIDAEQQRSDSALALYEAAVHRGDPTGIAANNLAWLYAQRGRNLDRALSLASRASQLRPSDPAVADTLGYVYLQRREYTHAVAALERARDLHPDSKTGEDIKRHLAEAYLRAGDSSQAATLLAQRNH